MRKTLIAMLGLVALGLWALPALAVISGPDPMKDPPKASYPIPLDNRAGISQRQLGGTYQGTHKGTLSGTLINNSSVATTTWYLYPGACYERAGIGGPWTPRTSPQADSLNTYVVGTTGPYGRSDESLSEIQWHVATAGDNIHAPAALTGSSSLWCGKYDANWVVKYGYPNITYQILYLDTGSHSANYNLTFKHNFSAEQNYDYVYLIGGLSGLQDPLGNDRAKLDGIVNSGLANGDGTLLVTWTGSITTAGAGSTVGAAVFVLGAGAGQPTTQTSVYTIESVHRALYFVFQADCLYSSEDGLWPDGHGQILDDVSMSDNGALYTEETAVGGTDAYSGNVIKGTTGSPVISARVPPGKGELWQLVAGVNLPTEDICQPKNASSDLQLMGGDSSTHSTVPDQYNTVITCSFPIPAGTASVFAQWDEYLDLPRFQGYVQQSEFRIFKDGSWGGWDNTSPGGGVRTGALKAWTSDGDELGAAVQADSVQIRYDMQCIPFFALDHTNCGTVLYGILYDNFRLEVTTGVPAPIFGVFPGSIAQSMFVDGTMLGTNCTVVPCWPGTRGTQNGSASAVNDNFNSPLGDSITASLVTGLRKNGKGINWWHGFDKAVGAGLTLAHTNPNFVAAYDVPRVIYRIFDPTTKAWSPWDSSELNANSASVSGPAGAQDTVLIDSEYRMNWPPFDKIGQPLPGSFTVNGLGNYNQIRFMPRGTRLQYYWKAVDLNGGRSYQFSTDRLAREVEDLPTLPGSSNVAPDIIEFDVLPRAYTAGPVGTLVAGSTSSPILDLDGMYSSWNYGTHTTVQALRAMGVRFDRYRTLQGLEEGGHIGGHELPGTRKGRLSNYFPNMNEYPIKALLTASYRIMIESSHTATSVVDEAQDAKLIKEWWIEPTGTDGGDRCIFASGDNYFSNLLAHAAIPTAAEVIENDFASSVFGVAVAADQSIVLSGYPTTAGTTQFPNVYDRFADPAAGPALGTSGAYQYVSDGGCPAPNRFDALTAVSGGEALVSATYNNTTSSPTKTDNAAIKYMTEKDVVSDHDRNKALGYGFSIQFIRQSAGGFTNQNEPLWLANRALVLYKFLTSCRGPRTVSDTASCWPCPTDANKYSNWATSSAFNIGTYGPLYPIQDDTRVQYVPTGVEASAPAPALNRMKGNFPNPFNPETAIRFTSAGSGRVEVRIYDVAGRLVQTLSKSNVVAGVVNEVRWNGKSKDGADLASGIYFVKLRYPDGSVDGLGHKVAIVR